MTDKTYIFHAELSGTGADADEAWENAVEALSLDAGDCPPYEIEDDDDDDWQERLDEAQAGFDHRQAEGEVITCAVCDSEIQPDEGVEPCFKCCAPMCGNCSTSGPRCRGCTDL